MLLDQLGDEAGPTGLMRRPEAAASITVKIFMEPIAFVIALLVERIARRAAESSLSIFAAEPNADNAVPQFVRDTV